MLHIVPQNSTNREEWLQCLADVITDPLELLTQLQLQDDPELLEGIASQRLFPLRVPRDFVNRMVPGQKDDPLLQQVITLPQEALLYPGFSTDPLQEQQDAVAVPGLLHKYGNRALLLVKTGCAINCRFCFRRHFPYQQHPGGKQHWQRALEYIRQHTELDEILFSGGDPLMAKDHELSWLIGELEKIAHIKRLRIHTRLPVVIPSRITRTLCKLLRYSRLQVVLVTHINHGNEIDEAVRHSMSLLKQADVTLLNQSVLLRGVNDSVQALSQLSYALFDAGILPYYLHVLDRVQGTAHFLVEDQQARELAFGLIKALPGYLVPRLVREVAGQPGKIPLDLNL
ncbi:MAG: EF-P beta-lysylation protein EpmB [Enterobacteriaceae bacterium]